jgi:hypothetical protein
MEMAFGTSVLISKFGYKNNILRDFDIKNGM